MNLTRISANNIGSRISYPEFKRLRLLFALYTFLIFTDYLMPQYFGVHIGYDITCTRLANIVIITYMFLNPRILTHFCSVMTKSIIFVPSMLYLFVCTYTCVLRTDVNAFFLPFLEFLTLFMLIYAIRYVIGYKRTIRWSVICAYILSIYGLVEYVCKQSLMLKFLSTVPTNVVNSYRSGHYRIMGPCGHSLGYGLLLILFIAIASIDEEKDEVYLYKRPFLIILLILNVFLTGSRSTLGVMGIEVILIFILSKRKNVKKTIFVTVTMLILLGVFLLFFSNTSIGRYILMQITSVIDQLFGTSYAVAYGAEIETLENSENYRKVLPLIFTLDWLNPLVGRGVLRGFGATINGVYIKSIDNYYVQQYIKYAYPGLVTYIIFILTTLFFMIKGAWIFKSGICKLAMVGTICYFLNLWWLDALQTLKYEYILIAIFVAFYLEKKEQYVGN